MTEEAYVYVLESGAYENRGVDGVYATPEDAMMAFPVSGEDKARRPGAGWKQDGPLTWDNGCDWESGATITGYRVEPTLIVPGVDEETGPSAAVDASVVSPFGRQGRYVNTMHGFRSAKRLERFHCDEARTRNVLHIISGAELPEGLDDPRTLKGSRVMIDDKPYLVLGVETNCVEYGPERPCRVPFGLLTAADPSYS